MALLNKRDKNRLHLNFLLLILIFALVAALILASHNYDQLLFLLLPLLIFIVWKSNLATIIIISLVVFFGDWLIGLKVLPPQFMWGHELLVLLIFIKAIGNRLLRKTKVIFVGGWIILAFLVVSLLSLYINKSGFVNLLLFLRLVLNSYLLFLAVINLDLEESKIKIFLNTLLALIVIQLPVAVIKLFIYGQGEQAIGTYDYHGGTLSTALPLIVIGFGFSYFLMYKKSFFFIGLVLGAVAFAIIGGKRGFIFFLPLILIFLSWYLKDNFKNLFRYAVVGGVVFFIALYFALSFVPRLSPESGGRSFDPGYAIDFATDYTTRELGGVSWGRTRTNINVFKDLADRGIIAFLFGTGPGSVMKTRFATFDTREKLMEEFNIGYGITGLSWIAINVGYLGMFFSFFLIFWIMRRCTSYYSIEKNPFWRSFGLGMIVFSFVMIIINFAYAPILLVDMIAIHYFLLSGFVILKEKELCESNHI